MIYTVTLNPSLDYVVTLDDFKCGEINRALSEDILPGGKGINVSIVLTRLGVDSKALGFTAGFTGKEITGRLAELGVKSDFIFLAEGTSRINVKIRGQDETAVNGRGPRFDKKALTKLKAKLSSLTAGDWLVLSGLPPEGSGKDIYADIMRSLPAENIKVIVDTGGDYLVSVLNLNPFLIKPNRDELGDVFHVKIETKEAAARYGGILCEKGAQNVLVSLDKEGAVLVNDRGDALEIDAPQGKVLNTVGTGDALVAGFVAGYLKNGDPAEALRLGVCLASASAFNGLYMRRTDIDEFYDSETVRLKMNKRKIK